MKIQELLERISPELIALAAWLEGIAAKYPDLAPEIEPKVLALRTAASPTALADLGTAVVSELSGLVRQGITEPRVHPSDLA